MVTGTTRSGFVFELDDAALNDMELFEALCEIDNGNTKAVVSVVKRLLGDRKQALYDHLRVDGRVPIDKVVEALTDILTASGNGKKS